ncbi:DUF3137 domain-containing protein [bacterium]|nr:DUF3137 domain-containing protein [bacterium]
MTIPSIGGNGLNSIKIIQSGTNQIPEQVKEAIDIKGSDSTLVSVEDKNVNLETQKHPETEENSVEQFKKDYEKILYDKVLPELEPYEKERKLRFAGVLTCAIILGIVAFVTYFWVPAEVDRNGDLTWGSIALAGFIWFAIKKSFEKKVKRKIMPKLMRAFPGFYWQQSQTVTNEEIDNVKFIPESKRCSKRFDDAFIGKYRDVEINIAECEYNLGAGNNKKEIFNGAIIRIKMNKNFEGLTIIRPQKISSKDLLKPKKDKKAKTPPITLEKVELEDIEFNKKYNVFSTDQIESRYLITTGFMERFNKLSFAFHSKGTYCAFFNKYIYIAPHVKGDLFNLFSLRKPVTDTKQFQEMFDQIVSVLEMVDYFKLDKKLGL